MASTIQIKNSNTAGNAPSSLTQGELAINVNDGNLFYGDGSSVKQDFAVSEITASVISITGTNDNTFSGRIVQDNNKFLAGTETGGTARNILGINDSDITQVANANIATNIKGTSITLAADTTLEGNITLDTNNDYLRGKTTGGAIRNIIGISDDNVVDVGNSSVDAVHLEGNTSINGNLEITGSLTVNSTFAIEEPKITVGETGASAGDSNGIIIREGNTATTQGKIYYYTSAGEWALTDADAEASATGLLGVAIGTNSGTKGMLIQGCVTLATDPGSTGDILYLQTDTAGNTGDATSTAPNGQDDIVRIIGYCLDNAKIYFNPSNDFIKHS